VDPGARPQTLAFALTDCPAGLAAWIAEKFRAWSDNDGTIESAIGRDRMLANISLYWFTGSIGASFWPYYADAWVMADPRGADGRRADGLRRLRARDPPPAAQPRHARLHRHPPLDGDAEGRPIRRAGAAGGTREEIAAFIRHAGQEVAAHAETAGRRQRVVDPAHFHGVVGAARPAAAAPQAARPSEPALLRPLAEYESVAGGGWR
jgi:microsomal epoxide hydrolase